jgi:hypothetical protein
MSADGQIVVARLGDEVTVKRLRRHARWTYRVHLLAENPSFEPIQVDLREQELVIEGLGVGVLRLGLAEPRQTLERDAHFRADARFASRPCANAAEARFANPSKHRACAVRAPIVGTQPMAWSMSMRVQQILDQRTDLWRGQASRCALPAGIPTGLPSLDAQLIQGGWPPGSLSELLSDRPGEGFAILVPALARLSHQSRWLLLVEPPVSALRAGAPVPRLAAGALGRGDGRSRSGLGG